MIDRISQLDPVQLESLKASLLSGNYNLFLGAGVSLDSQNAKGDDLISGGALKDRLCTLTGSRQSSSLQRVFSALTPEQIETEVTSKFSGCTPGLSLIDIPKFLWKRIYTLNIDDALDKAYELPGAIQSGDFVHFKDPFSEPRTLEKIQIVHLHGFSRTPEKGYVFARAEYATQMADTNAWMTVLADIMPIEPFIVAGIALDEVDLDFYLARRSSHSIREDRGPSFFVEPYPDAHSEAECGRYGLTLFHGTIRRFIDELIALVPHRFTALQLISPDNESLFAAKTDKRVITSFSSDFDRVPARVKPSEHPNKFLYGQPPQWSDISAQWDVGRAITKRARAIIDAMLSGKMSERMLIINDGIGTGKSTVLRRLAYDIANDGIKTILCSAFSRLEPKPTAAAINAITGPLLVIVDNVSEQSQSLAAIFDLITRKDVVFCCTDRKYRMQYVLTAFAGIPHRTIDGMKLQQTEAKQLIDLYTTHGLVAKKTALIDAFKFSRTLANEPVAVAGCKILNDLRPLDTLIDTLLRETNQIERKRYVTVAIAEFCYRGGIKRDILGAITGRERFNEQVVDTHPLPIAFSDKNKDYIVPLNITIAERTLDRVDETLRIEALDKLAVAIASRVNRSTIQSRSPEARLASRLFDYEEVLQRFAKDRAGDFYEKAKRSWRWNSRFWEQYALYYISRSRAENNPSLLDLAIQHARHAVSVETHPFTLTTLAKALIARIPLQESDAASAFNEAFSNLTRAIDIEKSRNWASVQAYLVLFSGARQFLDTGGRLSGEQVNTIESYIAVTSTKFKRDRALTGAIAELQRALSQRR